MIAPQPPPPPIFISVQAVPNANVAAQGLTIMGLYMDLVARTGQVFAPRSMAARSMSSQNPEFALGLFSN